MSILNIFNIPDYQYQFELPYLYWIPKLHKNPQKQRYKAGHGIVYVKATINKIIFILRFNCLI